MQLDFAELSASQIYFTLIQTVVPRPIAWVLTSNEPAKGLTADDKGLFNLAPFSYFTPVSSAPPVLAVSIGKKPDGSEKDTLRNIKQHKYAVVHIASIDDAVDMTESSRTREYGDSEVAAQNLELFQQPGFNLPRLEQCKIALDCEFYDVHELGKLPQSLLLLQVNRIWVDDSIAREQDGRLLVDAEKLNPLARLGANAYAGLTEPFIIPRPK